jgi:hypothetical protein
MPPILVHRRRHALSSSLCAHRPFPRRAPPTSLPCLGRKTVHGATHACALVSRVRPPCVCALVTRVRPPLCRYRLCAWPSDFERIDSGRLVIVEAPFKVWDLMAASQATFEVRAPTPRSIPSYWYSHTRGVAKPRWHSFVALAPLEPLNPLNPSASSLGNPDLSPLIAPSLPPPPPFPSTTRKQPT